MSQTTHVDKFTPSTSFVSRADVIDKLKAMNVRAEGKGWTLTAKEGDSQHPNDVLWALQSGNETLHSGSVPTTSHGKENIKAALKALNDAIDELNA